PLTTDFLAALGSQRGQKLVEVGITPVVPEILNAATPVGACTVHGYQAVTVVEQTVNGRNAQALRQLRQGSSQCPPLLVITSQQARTDHRGERNGVDQF